MKNKYQRLKRIIKQSDWTAKSLAGALKISSGKFSELLNGKYQGKDFTRHQKLQLAFYLGMYNRNKPYSIKYLFSIGKF